MFRVSVGKVDVSEKKILGWRMIGRIFYKDDVALFKLGGYLVFTKKVKIL